MPEDARKEVLVRGLNTELYAKCSEFLDKFGVNMNHVNRIILEKGYSLILSTESLESIKEEE